MAVRADAGGEASVSGDAASASETRRSKLLQYRSQAPRSGKRDGWVGEAARAAGGRGRRGRDAGRVLDGGDGARLRLTQPFWRAIFSPCLITVRSISRASGWARRSRDFSP